jgi:plasmid rolling circle replication initiator protein Rep
MKNDGIQDILTDKTSTGKERPWKEKKEKTIPLAESYRRLKSPKADRVEQCGTFLEFKRYKADNSMKLHTANFCKVRLCPLCSWRRSLKIFSQVSTVINYALDQGQYRFLFLTLTCENVPGEQLVETIDKLFKALHSLFHRKQFKKSIVGSYRGFEVTHNLDIHSKSYDTYHPHFHLVLMVNDYYFKNKDYYITQDTWVDMWQESLKVDYKPTVDIRAFKTASKKNVAKSIAETAKYTVKDNDYLVEDEETTDRAVALLDEALAHRRLTAFSGKMKEIHSLLNLDHQEDGDLINTGDTIELNENLDYVIERYNWNIGYKQYYKMN